MRALPLVVFLLLALIVLLPLLRRRRVAPSRTPPDELVKDPVCQTYVVRSRAVAAVRGGPHFCSAECARRWAREAGG